MVSNLVHTIVRYGLMKNLMVKIKYVGKWTLIDVKHIRYYLVTLLALHPRSSNYLVFTLFLLHPPSFLATTIFLHQCRHYRPPLVLPPPPSPLRAATLACSEAIYNHHHQNEFSKRIQHQQQQDALHQDESTL